MNTATGQGPLVIVGAGNAASELAVAARQHGWAHDIVVLGAEAHLPYHRPPLSKVYLAGTAEADTLLMRTQDTYAAARVEVRTGVHVTGIDRTARRLALADGSTLPYAMLAICTGGRARALACSGMPANSRPENLHYVRTRDDVDALRAQLAPGKRLAVVGGGYVGLEVAASARKLGAEVVLLEAEARVLARVTGPQLSRFYEDVHRSHGVDIRTATQVERISCGPDGHIDAVVCSDGKRIEVDAVVAGIGMLPNAELAAAAGLAVDGGIVVDAFSRTSDPLIFAAGDCTVHDSALYGRRIRLESVPNALEQARAAAMAICGKPRENKSVPWFWSDQYDYKLQMAGLSQGYGDVVLRGSIAEGSFVAFYLKDGVVIGADAVNRPADFMVARKLVEGAVRADPAQLADPGVALRDLAPRRVPAVNP